MKKLLVLIICLIFISGCIATTGVQRTLPVQEVKLTIQGVENVTIQPEPDQIHRTMEVPNDNLKLSHFCRISGDVAYYLMTGIYADNFWEDCKIMLKRGIKTLYLYMNNPGGSLVDMHSVITDMEELKSSGIEIIAEGRGYIASAAIPIFVTASKKTCGKNALFLIHPSSIFKYGYFRETLKDLESQTEVLTLQRSSYAERLAKYCSLTKEDLLKLLEKDSYFTAQQAKEWGMVDEIIGE